MPVVVAATKNRPSKRRSRLRIACQQISGSSSVSPVNDGESSHPANGAKTGAPGAVFNSMTTSYNAPPGNDGNFRTRCRRFAKVNDLRAKSLRFTYEILTRSLDDTSSKGLD